MVLGTSRDSHDDLRLLHAQSGMERSYLVRFSLLGLTQGKHAVGLGSTNTADEPPADSKAMPSCLDSNALNLNTKCSVGMATFWLHSVRLDISLQKTGCGLCLTSLRLMSLVQDGWGVLRGVGGHPSSRFTWSAKTSIFHV